MNGVSYNMIGKLITSFFNFLLKIIMSIIQLICLPINALFEGIFPDFSDMLLKVTNGLNVAFSNISLAISIIPPIVREVCLFIITIELSMLVVMRSAHMTSKVWNILQKLKFW